MSPYYVQSGKLRRGPLTKERILQAIRDAKLPIGSEIIDAGTNEIVLPDELLNPGIAFVSHASKGTPIVGQVEAIEQLRSEVALLSRQLKHQTQRQNASESWIRRSGTGFITAGTVIGLFALYHVFVVVPMQQKLTSLIKWSDQPFLVAK